MTATKRLTVAQATIEFLACQFSEQDGAEQRFIPGIFGIFGHGNLAGIGQAILQSDGRLKYHQARNEQAMVHAAAGYAKQTNRLATLACTTSIGPGATNMLTAASGATINRLPVLLLPGDIFANRRPGSVLQQLEIPQSLDASVNDAFRSVSRYWDRINRPEQLPSALLAAMRVLTDPAETGAVVLALPQDVQAEAWDFPIELFDRRTWHIARQRGDAQRMRDAAALVKARRRPLIIAGGGVIYSGAERALRALAETTGIPVAETQAGKGSLDWRHPLLVGPMGVSGSPQANAYARAADLVIGVGTRYTDFTTASQTEFQNPDVRFVNINVATSDAVKQSGHAIVADAKVALDELLELLGGHAVTRQVTEEVKGLADEWRSEVDGYLAATPSEPPSQAAVIGVVNDLSDDRDVVVCAAGSLPGDLHRLWRAQDPKSYHMEYGYSCMGYEVAGGLGVRMAAPDRDVFVFVGDGSFAMMSSEILTAIQEQQKLIVMLINNVGFGSINALSVALGSQGFGTQFRFPGVDGHLTGDPLPFDLANNAASLGAQVATPRTVEELRTAVEQAKSSMHTTVIVVDVDPQGRFGGSGAWWDVPVSEVSELPSTQEARVRYEQAQRMVRTHY